MADRTPGRHRTADRGGEPTHSRPWVALNLADADSASPSAALELTDNLGALGQARSTVCGLDGGQDGSGLQAASVLVG